MYSNIFITKRDGKSEAFSIDKIRNAVTKAYRASGIQEDSNTIGRMAEQVASAITGQQITVEEIQDLVEKELMASNPYVAKKYIIYREWRTIERDKKTHMKQVMDGIVAIEKNDVNLSNANMSAHTPAGQMMTFASEVTKDYANKYLLGVKYARAHRNGDIHIHDLDYYPTKTTTCIQYDLDDLFERGFRTKNGSIRTPQSIQSYATLATIIFQTNQNEQHGGQSIPAFDFFMAKGVRKTFVKHLASFTAFLNSMKNGNETDEKYVRQLLLDVIVSIDFSDEQASRIISLLNEKNISIESGELTSIWNRALKATRKDTHQAMEGFIHNLNTMHSRGGNQVVFSSINYGTDTSAEGRLLIRELLSATSEGLGHGEVPVFPIQIFKVKEGISYSDEDYALAMADFEKAMRGEIAFKTPNFDLLLEACRTTSVALFPNFIFLDAPFNQNALWKAEDPERYRYEVASMGCRTRVFENMHGEKSSLGRGNLSFTSMNMPRLAIKARREAEELNPDGDKHTIRKEARQLFLESVRGMSVLIAEQLYDRYQYQRTALARQFPFMMGNDVWKGGSALDANDEVGDVINSGTLGIGFIGGHNAMVAIHGEGHAHNQEAWETLREALEVMNSVASEYKEKYKLNYSVLATPAEGLSGRFTRIDRKVYGIIPGVNDRDYYVNSFHIDVKEPVSILEKIKKEAPFHALTGGGHITYVELDGEAKKNIPAILKIVKVMYDQHIGYGSINHPVDTCKQCGYKGVIYDKCPVCSSEYILRLRRITGYLTGSLESWNSAKKAEESDRTKHH
ncbi:MAG: anaerobic ribonucleoside triphosphate reductase [Parabacteroides sp.]|jgi:anaerobic ribonucleoside-triphosphate reductase|nr:anaerobic ribonucleoside triphosphate reductase [Parabacteroides sp.]MBP8760265.1 anaerobic ribonucleoside triphosphate reductase [Parabacteroides sp.]MBP9480880.1 anaerobic ribonucleoside triphosphate reductase [Parabacteroides sp.]MBP9579015.1 anaerobic ribonucleoside triphosphate reductase [Parabacteroides sp.]MDD2416627.1 anaerobic ribonucleoside triphosphate reductase [Parabacteroides sp.]